MNYEALALLLMVVGLALIVAEVFLPSGGLILVMCVVSFAASVWFAYKAWWGVSQGYFWIFIGALIVLIPGSVIGLFRFLESSSFGNRVLLGAPTADEVVPYQAEIMRLGKLVGKRGEALTLMTPGGMVLVEGERLHAISEGTVIEPHEAIEVVAVRGTRVVVRSAAEDEPPPSEEVAPDLALSEEEPDEDAPLDFDLPRG